MHTNPLLEKNLQVRVSREFEHQVNEIAKQNNLKPSTFLRLLMMRHVPEYHPRNRFI